MKITLHQLKTQAAGVASIATLFAAGLCSGHAQDLWTGNGSDANWQSPGNWQSGNPPLAGDSLIFTGVNGLNNTNNFLAGTAFGGLTFQASAGNFVLKGNSLTLNGNITNGQVVTEQAINLPMVLGTTSLLDIVPNGILTINGVLSGGGGLTMVDDGQLNLNAANTFTGALTLDAGTAVVWKDANLGAAPSVATPGSIVLDGGTLRATNTFTLNPNRGIAVGSASGGAGTIKVDTGKTVTYGGIISGNGGAGGLAKSSFGGLTLSGANTYTGPTVVKNGNLTLNFAAAGAPANNIVNGSSSLTLGGDTAGSGLVNNSTLAMSGNASTVNSQAFNGSLIDLGGAVIQATSGSGGTANLALGTFTHNVGGTVVIIRPATGNITTTSGNDNGILGGWATIGSGANQNGALIGTNYATVDTSGNIVNFTDYLNWSGGNLAGQVTSATNLLFAPAGGAQVITVDNANAGTMTEVNSINIQNPATFSGIYIGTNNTLRLGRFGGILAQETAAAPVVTFGGVDGSVQNGNGEVGAQNIGTLTAGGAPNTSGEIDLTVNNNSETSGSFIMECQITDNGTAPVTFVKSGPGPMKLDGHNTFSGGLYLLAGRLQFAGTETGTGNPDGAGSSPIYVYPGAEFYPSGVGSTTITNNIFLSGNGVSDNVGAIRMGTSSPIVSGGVITLFGDAQIGGGGAGATQGGPIYDQITGPYNFEIGAFGNSGSGANGLVLYNQSNDWSGNTIIVGRTGTAGNTLLHNGTNDVIPNGFGMGNMEFGNSGNTVSVTAWDLNGFNETVNGLISIGTVPALMYVSNSIAHATSTLTVGDNDVSGTFIGGILNNIAFTKIGAGVETLAGVNTYTGNTTVSGGTLALIGGTSISTSLNTLVQDSAILDVTGLTNNFSYPNNLSLNDDGTLLLNEAATVGTLNMTNGRVRVANINSGVTANVLNAGGATNFIDVVSVGLITGYPAQFTAVKYSGTLNGSFNFGLGNVPSASTTGYISNNVANGSIDVVLLSGPEPLTWTGINGSDWDIDTTINWLAFGTTPSTYSQVDAVTFNDSASTGTVNLTTAMNPGLVEVTNNTLPYIFTGSGAIGGFGSVTKDGTGILIFDNSGINSFSGGFLINSGTVQVGNNDAAGNLPAAGGVQNNAEIVFDRNDNVTVGSTIIGSGSLTQNNTNILTLSGNNGFTGPVTVSQGTLLAGSGSALGTADGATTISPGATLDVSGQTLTTEPIMVSGTGVNGLGAIVNSGADITTALGNVTLAGDTTFGGTGRWDIRGGTAQLLTSSQPYNLTKIGTNQISLVGINVDGSLGDINVQSGTLSIEEGTTGLGNSGNTLTVASGATLQLYAATAALNKQFVLNGNGVTTTLNIGSGAANAISGPITLNGNCIFNAAAGTAITFSGTLGGGGSLAMTGAGTNIMTGGDSATYTGGTTVNNSVLVVDGSLSGAVAVETGATLAGLGNVSGAVTVQPGGGVAGGDIAADLQGTLTVGNLALNNSTATFHLSNSPGSGNDRVNVSGSLTFGGVTTLQIVPLSFMNVGDIYTLFTYGGSTFPSTVTNNLLIATSTSFAFSIVDPATTPGSIQIHVDKALGNDVWTGQASALWDTAAANWARNSSSVSFNNGDYVNFDDSSSVTNVILSGELQAGNVTMNNGSETYHFGGSGSVTGSGGLLLASGGGLVIANSGSNDFTGPITINSGTLQLGDGGASGNLGSGIITNNGSLVFDRSDTNLAVNNVIAGNGSGIVNNGPGEVKLGGANTFVGNVNVLQGTLGVENSSALGNTFNTVTVNSGATLDITNTANISVWQINVGGAGVDDSGAIVNNSGSSTFVGQNIGQVLMTSDTTFGGSGRLDFRASAAAAALGEADAALYTSGDQPFTFTKLGTNLMQMAGVQIDPGLGDIIVGGGTLGIQWNMSLGIGDPSHSLIVSNGASFAFFDMSNAVSKVMILNDGASILGQHGNGNIFSGPVTLQGTNTFNVSGGTLTFNGTIGGAGNLVKTGAATLILSTGPETYAGNTYVNGGILALTDVAALSDSLGIILSNAIIDVSGRNDGTLSLDNQTLAGGGTINGVLAEDAGSTVVPGNGITTATLTVTNSTTLNGNVIMDINRANTLKSDEVVSPVITAGGILTVTNLGSDLLTGDTFQLFSVPVSGFTTVNLPVKNAAGTITYQWENDLATDGSVKVLQGGSGVNTNPTNITAIVSGGSLNLSWPADHTGWLLQVQTNTLSAGLGTNWVDVAGSTSVNQYSAPIDSASGAVFYRLIYQP